MCQNIRLSKVPTTKYAHGFVEFNFVFVILFERIPIIYVSIFVKNSSCITGLRFRWKNISWYSYIGRYHTTLTHLFLDKMAAVSQMIFVDELSWMKSFAFWLKVHLSLFIRAELTITQKWFRWWLGAYWAPNPLSEPIRTRRTRGYFRW